jgi:simple sugar transport system permease protein
MNRSPKHFLTGPVGVTLFSMTIAFIMGGVILFLAGYDPLKVYGVMVEGVFGKPKYMAWSVIKATPLIMTGLSVAFAFRTGLFNIGAEGQFILGSTVTALLGYYLHLPALIHIPLVFFAGVFAGACWGAMAGYLKARFGIHEVISTIMLNWIALYSHNYVVAMPGFARRTNISFDIQDSACITLLKHWKLSETGRTWFAAHPVLRDIFKTPVNPGFLMAIFLVILVWYILNRTTLGYRLRAVGFNRDAAEFGGIDVKRSIVLSMFIAGGLAGAAGALQVMGVARNISTLAAMEGYGFDGIAIALIGNNSAFGCLFAGLLFGALKFGGVRIQSPPVRAPMEIINIMIGTIVFFIAMPRLIKMILRWREKRRENGNA